MIEPVNSRSNTDLWEVYASYNQNINSKPSQAKDDTDAAEEEVVSFYYLSSIQSLQNSAVISKSSEASEKNKVVSIESEKTKPSSYQRFKSWLWGLFGSGSEPVANTVQQEISVEENGSVKAPQSPQLKPPEAMTKERLSKAIADLNRDLWLRLKDTAEFEAEMRKSNSKSMDRLILVHIIAKSLDQKKLKEIQSVEAHEEVLNLQKVNKDLHMKYYKLVEDIAATAKTNSILHWVNIGTTAGIAGTMAVGFAIGGAGVIWAIALPALNILKGTLTGAEGVLKYRNDLRTGEMTMVNHDFRSNKGKIEDKVSSTISFADEEISNLLKTIRHHIENYQKEARLTPQVN